MKALHVAVLATVFTCFLATSVDALKCHVCEPDLKNPNSCKATDLGVEEDGCSSCYLEQLNDKQFSRLCMPSDKPSIMTCQIANGFQSCNCNNTDLCNKVLKPLISCYVCNFKDDPTSCTNKRRGRLEDKCLMCHSRKVNDKSWVRSCVQGDNLALGCRFDTPHQCFCDTDRCNAKEPTMKCYVCKPKSARDTSCNWVNSGSVQDGCLTCSATINSRKITTRSCNNVARGLSRTQEDGSIECDTDLCNGEGDVKIDDGKASRGLQKTVSSRLLIGAGIMTAMLGLARIF